MPDGAWAMSLIPTGLILFLGLLWWLDTLIKRSQANQARQERSRYKVKSSPNQMVLPPTSLKSGRSQKKEDSNFDVTENA